ncbi:uncharacterized protein TNIN_307581 [Trichonephila inaurata madagascariensis]|uniref:Uncharacterized protein n=1 Tax=Trichonephila inaurata madagascariensis TaxID=2747483 RepID=A0A8X6MGB5_9ARAC|nr:uncharacterized protein TNIN_307581 [Trichonephila inaurata madagascariensis]
MSLASIVYSLTDIDRMMSMLNMMVQNSTSNSKVIFAIVLSGHQFIFAIHFLVFPGMVMILLSFIYLSFVKDFHGQLEAVRFRLLHNFSSQEVSKTWNVLTVAKSVHQDIEVAFSFITFLAYILTFGNILNVVSIIVTKFLSDKENMQYTYSYTILSWTVLWFVVLTVSGTKSAKIESFIKNLRQEVISKNFDKKPEGRNELACLNFFNAGFDCEFQFTGWGMFKVDKKLFLTISGILITYGMLFATEITKLL